MLKSIRLKNFFSFKDVKIELNPKVNILIGINGSGKSNLLNAVRLLIEGVSGKGVKNLVIDQWGGYDNIFFCGKNNVDGEISVEYEFDFNILSRYGFQFTEPVFYKVTIKKIPSSSNYYLEEKIFQKRPNFPSDWIYLEFSNGKGVVFQKNDNNRSGLGTPSGYEDFDAQELVLGKIYDPQRFYPISTIRKAIEESIVYDYFDTTSESKMRKPVLPTSEKRLKADGSNLAQMLNTIKINDKINLERLISDLTNVNSKYKGFEFNNIGGNIELMLDEDSLKKAIHVSNISNGTLRFLCLLSIFYNENNGNMICIDEPEVGLHPDMVFTICNAAKSASNKSQLIMTTHSENILNQFELENIKVFDKDDSNATTINSLTEEQFKDWYDEFSPGNMWRAGDLGGNRW